MGLTLGSTLLTSLVSGLTTATVLVVGLSVALNCSIAPIIGSTNILSKSVLTAAKVIAAPIIAPFICLLYPHPVVLFEYSQLN